MPGAHDAENMNHQRIALILLIVLAATGATLSYKLLTFADSTASGGNWLTAVCSIADEYGCDRVLQSRYGSILGHKTAAWGMVYFAFLAIWYLAVGRPNHPGRHWQLVPVALNGLGALMAAYLTWRMSVTLRTLCALCLAAHVINWAMLGLGVILRPRSAPPAPPDGAPPVRVSATPSPRLGVTALTLAMTLPLLFYFAMWIKDRNRQVLALTAQLTKLYRDPDVAMLQYRRQEKREIPIGPDDPVRGAVDPEHTVVVFSDFQCPRCDVFARMFRGSIESDASLRVRIVFKHFPLSPACNAMVTRNMHPSACRAAEAAEAARRLGGNEAFWAMHDELFMARTLDRLALEPYRRIARTLELDPDALEAAMDDPDSAKRIRRDIAQAKALGVRNTPTVFLDGRVVERWDSPAFWNRALGRQLPTASRPNP